MTRTSESVASISLCWPRRGGAFLTRNARQPDALDSRPLELHSERGYGAPSRDRRNAAGFPFCGGAWLISGGQEMNLWQAFNSEVDGKVFWPVIIIMLCVLVPIVLAIR